MGLLGCGRGPLSQTGDSRSHFLRQLQGLQKVALHLTNETVKARVHEVLWQEEVSCSMRIYG